MKTKEQLSIKGFFLPAIALCSLLLSGNAAHAALVTYSFAGGVSHLNGALLSTVNMGSPVSGTFQFNNATRWRWWELSRRRHQYVSEHWRLYVVLPIGRAGECGDGI